MSVASMFAPLLAQVALTFALMFWMGFCRFGCLNRGETKVSDIALGQKAWPEQATKAANNYGNQFELPVLFFAAGAVALATRTYDIVFVALAWHFVAFRIIHTIIHTTSNGVTLRFYAFLAGALVLLAMWVYLAAVILFA